MLFIKVNKVLYQRCHMYVLELFVDPMHRLLPWNVKYHRIHSCLLEFNLHPSPQRYTFKVLFFFYVVNAWIPNQLVVCCLPWTPACVLCLPPGPGSWSLVSSWFILFDLVALIFILHHPTEIRLYLWSTFHYKEAIQCALQDNKI